MANTTTAPADRPRRVRTQTRSSFEAALVRFVSFVFGTIEVLIALRFALKLFQANAHAGIVQLIYVVTDYFMIPFNAVFKSRHAAGSTLELSALVAIVVYALAGWGLVTLIRVLGPRFRTETVETIDKDDAAR
jgi:uncharacterized protein YggT (Ycf19 family)